MAQLIPVDHDPFDMAASLAAAGGDPLVPPPRNPAMPADWAQNAVRRVGGGLADILMAPRRAMDQGMTTAEAVPWAGNAALTLAGTGAPAAVRGAAGIFGGRLAKTADQAALSKAEELAKTGAPREQIWNDTGWFQGGDGKWRFEIPDDRSILRFGRLEDARQSNKTPEIPTGDALNHSQLFAAYPQMATETTTAIRGLGPNQRGVFIKSDPLAEGPSMISLSKDYPAIEQHSSLLHELQHGVQGIEGFPTGGNAFGLKRGTPAWDIYQERLKAMQTTLNRETFSLAAGYDGLAPMKDYNAYVKLTKKVPPMADRAAQEYAVQTAYKRNAGEVEARNVQSRMNMTPEERRARPPWLTEDVPAGQQIFGPASGGGQYQLIPVDHDPFNVGSGAIIQPKQGIRAYHGSPHDFDRFDISKIGTGEGAQSYGHGLYFAENPEVADSYRWLNAPAGLGAYPASIAKVADQKAIQAGLSGKEARDFAFNFLNEQAKSAPPTGRQAVYDAMNNFDILRSGKAGHGYEVNINAKPEQFLDWDRPLAGQAAEPLLRDLARDRAVEGSKLTGGEAYQRLTNRYIDPAPVPISQIKNAREGTQERATSMLRESGIPGIKYLDQWSRKIVDLEKIIDQSMSPDRVRLAKQELEQLSPSSNYVVFDDKIIDILHKYGIGGLSMLPPAVAAHVQSRLIPVDHDPFAQ